MQFIPLPPSIQSHTYPSLSGFHINQTVPNATYNPPNLMATAQQYAMQMQEPIQEPTQVISTVMESVQVTETIMVPTQVTKTIQVPKQVITRVKYGAEGDQNNLEDEQQPVTPVTPAPAWLLREGEISHIFEEMDREVHGVTLACNRSSS